MRPNRTLCIVRIWIINLDTLWFIKPLSQNLSHLGNTLHMRWYLMLWAVNAALYFYVYVEEWVASLEYRNGLDWLILSLSYLDVVFSVLLPCAPYVYAILSEWHTHLAMGSAILYMLLVFHILYELLIRDIAAFQKMAGPYAMLIVFELLFYLLNGGVSTLLEICFPMTMSLYLYTVNSSFNRRNGLSK